MSAAWKAFERRVAHELGGRRAGPIGAAVSDIVGVPFSVEAKYCKSPGPPVYARWVQQASVNAKREGLPMLLVVGNHHQNILEALSVTRFGLFCAIARDGGWIPAREELLPG